MLTAYPGSYTAYRQRKADMLSAEAAANQRFDKVLAQEEAWIRKGVEARRTRSAGRVARLLELRRERAARRERQGTVSLTVDEGDRSGKLVAELDGVSKSFDGRAVVKDFTCRILRGDKVGLVGPNGAGKTTLLKLILGEIEPDLGRVRRGTKLSVAYYDQFRAQLDEEATVLDTIGQGSDYVELGGERKHVMSYLADFLFPPQRVRSPVKSLSGGERNRLLLARLFTKSANLLVLDEPTNDLDIETLELLEDLLQDYAGTVLLVSHDRAFLDNVVTQVIAWDGDATWVENPGGYEEWARVQRTRQSKRAAPAVAAAAPVDAPKREAVPKAQRSAKLSFKEAKELEVLPGRISALEQEQADLGKRLADSALYRSDPEAVKTAKLRYEAIEQELMAALERWTELEARSR
jgi:ATP-binding cassette subfamily F protein uup